MARYTDAVCKLCRREGEKLFLKGERCFGPKCAVERRPYPPGMHGQKQRFRRKMSDYGMQLREKQKARRIYGVLERQFRRYFYDAVRQPGQTGENLLRLLERRLDNVVYRMGFADSRAQARQLVTHGHFTLNGRRHNIPSYLVKPGDVISVREGSRKRTYFKEIGEHMEGKAVPEWLEVDPTTLTGRVIALPERHQIDIPVNEQLIVEYYSR
ncbi:MAG: 30S ribosomal protein S4 [Ardenticatenia bacterium]|uniref:Small ribosomal subunit protein uS4 n=1 Tax=Ardenticatena maritima TaxID=872965 RepID=A0A0M8K7G0_9CHLR|nr:30S ribosomal protein S4 [Ardenticatena maritima]KPL90049.1 30S ribosomal protein S4 [Ardenticatena maritima]RME11741.1 MAG: 30S ribosomal protein S4 [Ardenticatenia bacterium]GAP61886.1 small subunit ribosomal protein S4 [Ardenticatena maritima]